MLTAVVTRAASLRGMLPAGDTVFGFACFRELLHSWGLLTREGFKAHMAGFAGRPPVKAILSMANLTFAQLAKICVPGAWLLDTTFRLIRVMQE